jgi:DNA-binding MarR family transcriptional regulator
MARKDIAQMALADVLRVESSCTCLNVRMAARVLTQRYDAALAPAGVRVTQFSLLVAVAGMQPVSVGDLAARLVMDRTTLTRNLQPLLDAGMVSSVAGSDRRRREIELTDAGRQALAEAFRLWKKVQSGTTATLGKARAASFLTHMTDAVSLLGGAP